MLASRCSLMILAVLFLTQCSFSQGHLLLGRQSGIGGSLGYSGTQNSSGLTASLGYSIKSYVDVGVGFTWASSSENSDISADAISPTLVIYPLKQDTDDVDPTVGISFSHVHVKLSGPHNFSATEDANSVGIFFTRDLGASPGFIVQPQASLAYATGNLHSFTGTFGFAVGTRVDGGHVFAVAPSVSLNRSDISYNVNATVVI